MKPGKGALFRVGALLYKYPKGLMPWPGVSKPTIESRAEKFELEQMDDYAD